MRHALCVLGIVCITLVARYAAASPDSVIAGSGCVPTDDSFTAAKFNMSNNAYNFLGSNTGDITLTCPTNIADGAGLTIFHVMVGGDGSDSPDDYYVETEFRKTDVTDGSVTTIYTCRSVLSVAPAALNCNMTDETADTDTYAYYFFVTIHRAATTYNPTFYSIEVQ